MRRRGLWGVPPVTAGAVMVIIPARMASTRFPGKPLVPVAGLPLIEHVRRRARLAQSVAGVVVATCDDEIRAAVEDAGGHVVMTSADHVRGTDRVEEAARSVGAEIIVNVQGDEPLLVPDVIDTVVAPLQAHPDLVCTNLLSPLRGVGDVADPDIVKAGVDRHGSILWFARWVRPFQQPASGYPVYRQTGIAAFRKAFLHRYAALAPTPFEEVESVDLWRVLEHGYRIQAVVGAAPTLGVDRSADVSRVEAVLREDEAQRSLFEQITAGGGRPVRR